MKYIEYYINKELIFNKDYIKIHCDISKMDKYIMMEWERDVMKKHADIVCKNGGDILELGFGMGISANYIQDNNINSHTIVEIHPQIINNAKEWMINKNNVILIEGDWFEKQSIIRENKYDGIFIDTIFDINQMKIKELVLDILKPNGIFTYFNLSGINNYNFNKDNFYVEEVKDIKIVDNDYCSTNIKKFFVPWVQI